MIEHKVVIYREPLLGCVLRTLTVGFIAGSKVDPVKFCELLDHHGKENWGAVAVSKETRRLFMIFSREAFVVIMKRQNSN